ncbi:FAD-binding protein [Phaeovulum sp.]|uniref:FAD-binding protein n=1 Tax=Phaeovulum sp. TaxID=2934796 RepID=UPI002730C37B|nr:FAD-binding protein [Phaeovulum sp.]MDP1667518.1 FAD-binding protein [Phaeovulum sp.]MDZ4120035.1 FAD-binding protein [Phaeovulum sp.]
MRPQDERELAAAIRDAAGPLRVKGGGTRGLVGAGEVLDTTGLCGVRLYEPAALTLVVGAGTPLAEVEALLAGEGQRLGFEPVRWGPLLGASGESTIGGVVAANVSGPRRVRAGAARDALIGVRFVDGRGEVIKSGGRVMKNVTGYDLVKLMAGSRGTLGVLSEVAFKLMPAAASEATLLLEGIGVGDAVAAMAAALGSPYEVSGAGWMPGLGAMLRLEGLAESVAYRVGRLGELMQRFATVRVERAGSVALWRDLGEVVPLQHCAGDVWRFSVKPSEAPGIVARLGVPVALDWGGGLIWAVLPEGTNARAMAAPYSGHATLMLGRGAASEPEAPGVAELGEALRAQFDPRGIFGEGLGA